MIHKIREKINIKLLISIIPVALFLLFILFMMITTLTGKDVISAISDTDFSAESLESFSDSFEDTLQENIYEKNDYINLNGLTMRTLGINSLNEREKLANGQLAIFEEAKNISESSTNIIDLNDFLNERGIKFLYLLAPTKLAFYDVPYNPGYSCDVNESCDSMIDTLNAAGISTIYMNSWFEKSGWSMDDVYFKTDHHWTPQAGMAAANVTMQTLQNLGWIDSYNDVLLREESYTIITLEDWFLGSGGKRVGIYYAGVDDLDVYFPNFTTNYTFSGLSSGTTDWYYSDTPLDLHYMDQIDYFGSDPYCIYLYGDNPLQRIINTEAMIDKRILVVGDSFRRTWQYFLSSQFQEIYSIDIRYYSDGTLAQYVEEIQPDIVIMCTGETASESEYNFGIDSYLSALEDTSENSSETVSINHTMVECQENNDNNYIIIYNDLTPGQTYTLTLESNTYTGYENQYMQMTLQNVSSDEAIFNRYFDVNSANPQKWIFTVPENANENYSIYLYAGTKGYTKNNVSVEVSNIELKKGVFEG